MEDKLYRHESVATTALNLLSEVCDICKQNQIDYYIAPKLVLRNVLEKDYEEFFTMPEIYMWIDGVLKFIEIVENNIPQGRSLDYLGNNENYSSFNVSYVNTETTCVYLARGEEFAQHGIRVTINIIRNDIKKRIPAIIETGRESNAFKVHKNYKWKKRLGKKLVSASMNYIGNSFNKKLFDYYIKQYMSKPDSKEVFVRRFRKRRMYFDRKIFDEKSTIYIGGRPFDAVKDVEGFLTTAYDENYMDREIRPYSNSNAIISNIIPFRDYLKHMEDEGLPIEKVFAQQKDISLGNNENIKILKSVRETFLRARLSEQRMLIYKELSPHMDEIREMYRNRDYEGLEEILEEYETQTVYFLKRELALCPCEELFEIECALMEHREEYVRAERMRRFVHEEHKKPLLTNTAKET